jgi:hypothetical protein
MLIQHREELLELNLEVIPREADWFQNVEVETG